MDREALVFRARVTRLISQARDKERNGGLKRQRAVQRLLRRRPGKPGGGDDGGDSSSSDSSGGTSGGEGSGACAACGKHPRGQLRACKGCHAAHYCNARCQRAHWRLHRDSCRSARCGGGWTLPHSCGELRVCPHCATLMFPGEHPPTTHPPFTATLSFWAAAARRQHPRGKSYRDLCRARLRPQRRRVAGPRHQSLWPKRTTPRFWGGWRASCCWTRQRLRWTNSVRHSSCCARRRAR